MNLFKRYVGKILFPRAIKFSDYLNNAFLESVKETLKFDASVRNLAETWLAVCPYTYFTELFLEKKNWNVPFVRAFCSEMIDAQGCYQLTRAFYLANLFRILVNDKEYIRYSKDTIIHNVISNMKFGKKIVELSNDFENAIKNIAVIEEFPMCYVEKILQKQYTMKNDLDKVISSIWVMSDSLFGLTVFTTESIKKAKYIDRQ